MLNNLKSICHNSCSILAPTTLKGIGYESGTDCIRSTLRASFTQRVLSLFPWARFRRAKGAVKLHTMIDIQGAIPIFIDITDGKVHDVNVLDILIPEAGSYIVMDRGYLDFERLYRLHQALSFFVIRAKRNLQFQRRYSHQVEKSTGVRSDQTVLLTGPKTSEFYPDPIRRVSYYSVEIDKRLIFLTNDFNAPACTIAALYRYRWQVELFFKWIKQHLRIKRFFGTSENSVKTQIWIAVSVHVLIAIMKKQLGLKQNLYMILQILSLTLFDKTPISCMFAGVQTENETMDSDNQSQLFNI
jgi:IS4 transposase